VKNTTSNIRFANFFFDPRQISRMQKSRKKTKRFFRSISTNRSSKRLNGPVLLIRRLQDAFVIFFFFFFFFDNDGGLKFLRNLHPGGSNPGRTAEKAPLPPDRYFLRMGARQEGRNPISDQNKRKDKSARTPQDARLIALIFFVFRFATSYPPLFSRAGKARRP